MRLPSFTGFCLFFIFLFFNIKTSFLVVDWTLFFVLQVESNFLFSWFCVSV